MLFAMLVMVTGTEFEAQAVYCTPLQIFQQTCNAGGDDGIDVGGEVTWPGEEPAAPDPGHPAPNPVGEVPGAPENPAPPPTTVDDCTRGQDDLSGNCVIDFPEAPEDPEEPFVPTIPAITVTDVASFAPAPTSPTIEPFGIAILGAPMNVAMGAETQTVGGALFGLPMAVTFVPELYTVDYGDGTVIETTTGSGTWGELGQAQLTATPTSHAYQARGTYAVSIDVSYSATVDFGVWGTYPVDGFVVTGGPGVDVRVFEHTSALVDRTCIEDPLGPGCAAV